MQVELFLEQSKNGELLLQYENYRYKKEETKETDISWTCSHSKTCQGSLTTDKFMRDASPIRPHNHDTNGSKYRYAARKWFRNLWEKTKKSNDVNDANAKSEENICNLCVNSKENERGRTRTF